MSDISKEDLEEIKSKGEIITISINARECSHHKENKKNIFVEIRKIMHIKGNRWMAMGQSFTGLHDVLIFSGTGEDRYFAKTLRILRGGLKAAT